MKTETNDPYFLDAALTKTNDAMEMLEPYRTLETINHVYRKLNQAKVELNYALEQLAPNRVRD